MAYEEDICTIDFMDHQLLCVFGWEPPFCSILRDYYSYECISEADIEIMISHLAAHNWSLKEYLSQTVIQWHGLNC